MWKYVSPEIANEIREAIKEDGMYIKEFAKTQLGMSYNHFANILGDNFPFKMSDVLKLCKSLNFDLDYILKEVVVSNPLKRLITYE